MHYDLIIIGGGIVGLATALRILEQTPIQKVILAFFSDLIIF